ncbi:hypothetical protein GIR22_14485 [Pseudomonas sp. CCM 7891]|uniref:Peptidase metallopeptidase domain-containing protein n=1 Tax=Pseudomonas karstica TaxID=1055468 RepID=A0A7X2RUT4_9PSED|nr:M12 family metallopeptidase [Pseudomonas karstica]MTD20332.1 hypothetical protein [Pseudomonas karstica]
MISGTYLASPSPPPSHPLNDTSAAQAASLSRNRRSVGEPGKYWPQNSTIKITIYDCPMDDPYVQAVKNAASQWQAHINLNFEFVSGEDGDVRITQNLPGDNSGGSEVGIDAKNTSLPYPTMSLPMDHTAASFELVVLHEFGHMLGAHHEHQHPDANIPWNQASLDARFTPQQQQVNFLPLPRNDTYDFSPYDGDSVMHYSIDPAWVTDNTWRSRNATLSADDIDWAKKAYPKPPVS